MTIAKRSLFVVSYVSTGRNNSKNENYKKHIISFKKSCFAYFLTQSNLCVFKISCHGLQFILYLFQKYSTRNAQIQRSIKQKKVAFKNFSCRLFKASLPHTSHTPCLILKSLPSEKLLYNEMKFILMIFILAPLCLVVEDQCVLSLTTWLFRLFLFCLN